MLSRLSTASATATATASAAAAAHAAVRAFSTQTLNYQKHYNPFSKFIQQPKTCTIIGAPLADGQPLVGVEQGPDFMRRGGLIERLQKDDWIIEDVGNIDFSKAPPQGQPEPMANQSQLVGYANQKVYEQTKIHAANNKFVLTLGGDHSIGIGSIAGILSSRPDAGVIWVDAHADINTPQASASKNIHGMVLSFLMNLENARKIRGFEWMSSVPIFRPERLCYIGLRDVDVPERAIIRQLGIKAFTMHEVDKYGIAKVMEMATDHVVGRVTRPLHLSFDIDSIDPLFAPSTGTRVSGGLSYREAYYIAEACAETGVLSSMDLVEVNPSLSSDEGSNMTVDMAVGLISSAMGNTII